MLGGSVASHTIKRPARIQSQPSQIAPPARRHKDLKHTRLCGHKLCSACGATACVNKPLLPASLPRRERASRGEARKPLPQPHLSTRRPSASFSRSKCTCLPAHREGCAQTTMHQQTHHADRAAAARRSVSDPREAWPLLHLRTSTFSTLTAASAVSAPARPRECRGGAGPATPGGCDACAAPCSPAHALAHRPVLLSLVARPHALGDAAEADARRPNIRSSRQTNKRRAPLRRYRSISVGLRPRFPQRP